MASQTPPENQKTRKGKAVRRRVVLNAANGKSVPEIASAVGLKKRRVHQILAEPETKIEIEKHQQLCAQELIQNDRKFLRKISTELDTPNWKTAADYHLKRLEIAQPGGGAPGTAVQVNVQQGNAVSLDELLAAHRPVGVVE